MVYTAEEVKAFIELYITIYIIAYIHAYVYICTNVYELSDLETAPIQYDSLEESKVPVVHIWPELD